MTTAAGDCTQAGTGGESREEAHGHPTPGAGSPAMKRHAEFHYRFLDVPVVGMWERSYNRRMARGFESKSVEAQQEEAARGRSTTAKPELTPESRAAAERKQALELTRARARNDLSRATAPAHRQMLEAAIAALDQQIAEIETRP
jgi:hypothetical protein